MRPPVFRALRELAYAQAGIRLGDEKAALVSARVAKRLRALKLEDEEDYLAFLREDDTGAELVEFLDVISTNFTSFFREADHFDRLRTALEHWRAEGQRSFRVWSAASSSGEEPYTIALVMSELLGLQLDWRILATDLSTRVLGLARAGRYTSRALNAVPRESLARSFVRVGSGGGGGGGRDEGDVFEVDGALKARVAFARLNLARPPFPMRGPFDVIFCRNVMIYFDTPVRQALARELERLVRPGGLVLVGHAESLSSVSTGLVSLAPSVYRRPEAS